MNPKTKEFRDQLTSLFIKSLEEKAENWERPWCLAGQVPTNAVTQRPYTGLNRIWLSMVAHNKGYTDPRWATFVQIKNKKWHLNLNAKGIRVEYWMPFDYNKKKAISWDEYARLSKDESKKVGLTTKYYTVFNVADITGVPPLNTMPTEDIKLDQIVSKLSDNMAVPIINDSNGAAFYRPQEDKIHTPLPSSFSSPISYNTICLHELAHATGASHRLSRDIQNSFGSVKYAYEELVAEITSTFFSSNLEIPLDESELKNHKAYVQSWINDIKEKPATLLSAIKEATRACDYMEYKAELIPESEYQRQSSKNAMAETQEASKIIQEEITHNGYTLTPRIISNINDLIGTSAQIRSLDSIAKAFKSQSFQNEIEKSTINNIGHDLALQERIRNAAAEAAIGGGLCLQE